MRGCDEGRPCSRSRDTGAPRGGAEAPAVAQTTALICMIPPFRHKAVTSSADVETSEHDKDGYVTHPSRTGARRTQRLSGERLGRLAPGLPVSMGRRIDLEARDRGDPAGDAVATITTLHGSPGELGLLGAVSYLPFVVFGVPAGLAVDRLRRGPILIAADLGKLVAIGSVPLLAAFGQLTITWLLAGCLTAGVMEVFFELAYQAYLPAVVPAAALTQANSRMTASESAAEIGGPGLGGVLAQLLGDSLRVAHRRRFLPGVRAGRGWIRRPEPAPTRDPGTLRDQVSEGFRLTFTNPYLRAFAGEAASYNLCWQIVETVLVLFAIRQIHLRPGNARAGAVHRGRRSIAGSPGHCARRAADRRGPGPDRRRRDRRRRPVAPAGPPGGIGGDPAARPRPLSARGRGDRLQRARQRDPADHHPQAARRPHQCGVSTTRLRGRPHRGTGRRMAGQHPRTPCRPRGRHPRTAQHGPLSRLFTGAPRPSLDRLSSGCLSSGRPLLTMTSRPLRAGGDLGWRPASSVVQRLRREPPRASDVRGCSSSRRRPR